MKLRGASTSARHRLASGRSARWAFWDRFDVPDYDHPERNYMTRWRLLQTPWFGIYIHRLDGPDPRETLHDHPWNFLSIILRGGYVERFLDPHTMDTRERIVRRFNHKGMRGAHTILRLTRRPTWTLFFVGRRLRTWGYLERDDDVAAIWLWTEHRAHRYALEFDAALAARRVGL